MFFIEIYQKVNQIIKKIMVTSNWQLQVQGNIFSGEFINFFDDFQFFLLPNRKYIK